MSEDILAHWKATRFIIAPDDLIEDEVILIVLSDYVYWADNTDELMAWCRQNNAQVQGMTVVLPDEAALTAFVLRWS